MPEKTSAVIEQRGLDTRPANSRELLSRKARERTQATGKASLESCFPPSMPLAVSPIVDESHEPSADPSATAAVPTVGSPHSPKAKLKLRPGDVVPNPGTVVAAIVRLVVERGELGRAELIALMTDASLAHLKARPSEKGWSQGYVAGAIRSGFLAVAGEPSMGETSTASAEEVQPC